MGRRRASPLCPPGTPGSGSAARGPCPGSPFPLQRGLPPCDACSLPSGLSWDAFNCGQGRNSRISLCPSHLVLGVSRHNGTSLALQTCSGVCFPQGDGPHPQPPSQLEQDSADHSLLLGSIVRRAQRGRCRQTRPRCQPGPALTSMKNCSFSRPGRCSGSLPRAPSLICPQLARQTMIRGSP